MSSQSQETGEEAQSTADGYSIRWFRSGDADGVRALFEDALGRTRSRAYVDWKYVDDPYLSHVPINVAERDGNLVGVQAYLPCRLRRADRTVLALQPADAVIHPDHRRNGLYTRMTRQAIDRYEAGEPSLFFNYPTEGALGAQRKLGWESLGALDVFYRIQRPSAFLADALEDALGGAGGRTLERVADVLARGALSALDRAGTPSGSFRVESHEEAPAALLASLYERSVPERLHVEREAQFYEWWLADPTHDYRTYVARSRGDPVAALVTRLTDSGVLQFRDAVPLPPNQPADPLRRLVATALADHTDADVVKSVGETLPADLLGRFGFVRDSAPVLDGQTKPLRMAARPLTTGDADGTGEGTDGRDDDPGGRGDVTDRANWLPTFLEPNKD
ncbi:Acetyltransferase (GNAT) domain-containing protein [Halomicrobium zhouii]|uniref:Acetyltransferase (GNAT) domain-containing protein n=1 Tax=Halomicrobium zhouii TaxID=767519 RepID=A0A1I6KLH5_9EURY|nr:GNAT family N-acetyltransferase [Halomicrobium zhouii]SFR92103.1 Acetyltransferase (GNAT) domain-containing protein [Halomicrobium zhouii]